MVGFCLLEKVSTKMLVDRDFSRYDSTALCDKLENMLNSIGVTLGDAYYNVDVHIFNASTSDPPSSDIAL